MGGIAIGTTRYGTAGRPGMLENGPFLDGETSRMPPVDGDLHCSKGDGDLDIDARGAGTEHGHPGTRDPGYAGKDREARGEGG